MAPIIFRCPNTGLNVQSWIADECPADVIGEFVSIQCTACRRTHLVSPMTGRTLGVDQDNKP